MRRRDILLGDPGADADSACEKFGKVSKTGQRWKTGCDRLAPNVAAKAAATLLQMAPAQNPPPKAQRRGHSFIAASELNKNGVPSSLLGGVGEPCRVGKKRTRGTRNGDDEVPAIGGPDG